MPLPKPWNEQVRFRLFEMPCCGQNLCWLNPRLPTYCPECGAHVLRLLRTGTYTALEADALMRCVPVAQPRKEPQP